MTTQLPIPKERLERVIKLDDVYDSELTKAMARALLAAHEQEPLGWIVHAHGGDQLTRDGGYVANAEGMHGIHSTPLYTHPAPVPAMIMPESLHPDTKKLVCDFASALAEKLYNAQLKYGYSDNWKRGDWSEQCLQHFHQHIGKGDPSDVAAYCAFMWFHGWKAESQAPVPAVPENPSFAVMQKALDAFYAEDDEVPENQMLAAYRVFRAAMLGGKS